VHSESLGFSQVLSTSCPLGLSTVERRVCKPGRGQGEERDHGVVRREWSECGLQCPVMPALPVMSSGSCMTSLLPWMELGVGAENCHGWSSHQRGAKALCQLLTVHQCQLIFKGGGLPPWFL
jgi:hypothetical protein